MLAEKRTIKFDGFGVVGTTPMLVPSISSKIELPMGSYQYTIDIIRRIINGPFLVSAYDLYYNSIPEIEINFPDLIFVDSGGYESGPEYDVGSRKSMSKEWTRDMHASIVKKWKNRIPTVMISFDHPPYDKSFETQVRYAKNLFEEKEGVLKEILIKPEPTTSWIDASRIVDNIELFKPFDIIGFTEKELGYSILERMVNIATIRKAMNEKNVNTPIHIFGSLDTITTPLYFLSGADIFDGLSWLRFNYYRGDVLYNNSHGPKNYGIDKTLFEILISSLRDNYLYMLRLRLEMEKFADTGDFNSFTANADFFQQSYDKLQQSLR